MKYLLLLLCSTFFLHSAEPDSTRRRVPKLDLESLSPDSFTVESDIMDISSGWFPRIVRFQSIEVSGTEGFILHQNSSILGEVFGMSGIQFKHDTHYSKDDRIPLQPFSQEDTGEDPIEHEFSIVYLRTRFSIPETGLLLRIGVGIRFMNNLLYAEDKSKSFLNLQNSLSPLEELHVINLDETDLMGNISLELPIYGASIEMLGNPFYSYYSLFGGMNLNYVLESNLNHQSFIMKGRDEIRYPSGSNVITIQNRSFLQEIERIRMSIETGLAWQIGLKPLRLSVESFVGIPIQSMLKNDDWSFLFIGVRASLGISF